VKKWGKSYGVSKLVRRSDTEGEIAGAPRVALGSALLGQITPMPSIRYPSRGVADTKKSRCGAEVSCSWR